MKTMYAITSLVAAAVLGAATIASAEAPKTGAPAPAFTVTDLDGKQHKLEDFKGKFVILEWNNFDCPFVARHYNSGKMQELQAKYTKAGAVWLAVNSGAKGKQGVYEPTEMKARTEKEKFAGTAYVYDTDGSAGKAYGAPTTPTMAIIDKEGNLAYWGAFDDKPKGEDGAMNYVSAAMDALMEGKPVAVPTSKPYGCGVKYQ